MTRAHQPCLNSASSRSRRVCVGILGAVGREGRNSRLSHYHKTSGLAQTREELVHTTLYIYKILHCHTETRVPHREALAPNIQILNTITHPLSPPLRISHMGTSDHPPNLLITSNFLPWHLPLPTQFHHHSQFPTWTPSITLSLSHHFNFHTWAPPITYHISPPLPMSHLGTSNDQPTFLTTSNLTLGHL